MSFASGSHYQAHSGLSPPSYRPCRAHTGEEGKILFIPNDTNEQRRQEDGEKNTLVKTPKAALAASGIKVGDLLKVVSDGDRIELIDIDKKEYKKTSEVKELDIGARNEKLEKRNSIVKGVAIAAGSIGAIVLVSLFYSSRNEEGDEGDDYYGEPEGKYAVKMYDAYTGAEIDTMDEVFSSLEEAEEYCDVCYADYSTGAEVLELAGRDFGNPGGVDFFVDEIDWTSLNGSIPGRI